ncbi:MAG: purine-binding chemotaxis protein CheW [bacterium]|nr:purine-binding chemotaxis protein CheW [bacterium]
MKKENKEKQIAQTVSYLCFFLGDQEYGIALNDTLEVLEPKTITPVPHTPPFLEGVINLRGNILAIIDIKILMGIQPACLSQKTKILIARKNNKTFGIIVDGIAAIRKLDEKNSGEIPLTLTALGKQFFRGLVQSDQHPLILLDLAKILDDSILKKMALSPS